MRHVIIATHGKLASGYQDSIEMICGKKEQITYMCFYAEDDMDYDGEIKKYMESVSADDEVLICTDMFSGSVSQKFLPFLERPNVFMITGINLPIVLEMVMYKGGLNRESIDSFVKGGISELYYVDIDKIKNDSDGDFF
jgi:mannose/fructose-specific phosphotransferase system component IIA